MENIKKLYLISFKSHLTWLNWKYCFILGFGHVNSENVFKVCDEPHPLLVKDMLMHCVSGDINKAYQVNLFVKRFGILIKILNNYDFKFSAKKLSKPIIQI